MNQFKLGVLSDSFRLGPREGVRQAKAVGADGFQIYAVKGEISPEMDAAARRDFKKFVADQGLEISALCGDLGGHGFQCPEENKAKVPRSKAIVDLAADLGTKVVTTHIGVVPADVKSPVYATMLAACRELGAHAGKCGVTFAIETGPEKATVLAKFLDAVGEKGMGVNLDPANLVMVVADDPAQAVRTLGKYIVHTHAKDGVQLQPCDPEAVYGAFANGGFKKLVESTGRLFEEVPLGQGGVDWDAYLQALTEIGYRGYLTIEREVGANPAGDISEAINFLRRKIGRKG